ncbi:MAG TPA: heavy-metal-associated domain-containing protein [Chloroflexota bacterium]|nr:heavy-metal-associated domain-containing protein [Chloroflexota bacterium]
MAQAKLSVPDIECEHCEHAITEALTPIAGVRSVRVDIPGKSVQLDYDESALSMQTVREILAAEEYPVASVTAG